MLRETIRAANNLRNGKGNGRRRPQDQSRPQNNGQPQGNAHTQPRRRFPPAPTMGEMLRAEIPRLNLDPAHNHILGLIADQLNKIEKPRGTKMLFQNSGPHSLILSWENTTHQHCITLRIHLGSLDAFYEYSMVCEKEQQLKPFPTRPLGSTLSERMDMNMNRTPHWAWLKTRIENTRRPTTV